MKLQRHISPPSCQYSQESLPGFAVHPIEQRTWYDEQVNLCAKRLETNTAVSSIYIEIGEYRKRWKRPKISGDRDRITMASNAEAEHKE